MSILSYSVALYINYITSYNGTSPVTVGMSRRDTQRINSDALIKFRQIPLM